MTPSRGGRYGAPSPTVELIMTATSRTLIFRFALFAALTSVAACADSLTSPSARSHRATRDTVPPNLADTLNCRGGYTIVNGRVVCNEQ